MLGIFVTIGGIQLAAIAMNILRAKIAAVLLGPQGVGIISVVDQFVLTVAQVSALGLPFAAVKFLSRSHSKGPDAFRTTYSSLLQVLALVTVCGAVASLVVVLWRPGWLGRELAAYRVFLFPALMSVPLFALSGFFSNVLAAGQQPRASALLTLSIAFALAASTYIGISLGGIPGLYWANLLAGLAVMALVFVYLRRKLGLPVIDKRSGIRDELRQNRDVISFSLILYGTAFAYTLSYFIARYSALRTLGEGGAGLLQAAIALATAINLLLAPVNGLYLTPALNRNIAKEEKLRAALDFQRRLIVIIGILAMPMILFPQWIITLFFSPAFVSASRVVFVFVVAQCLVQLAGVYQALLIGIDDLKMYGMIATIGHLSFAVLSWILSPRYGVLGIGIASLVASAASFALPLARLSSKHGFTTAPGLSVFMGYGLLSLLVVGWVYSHDTSGHPLVQLSKGCVYLIFLTSLWMFTGSDDRESLIQSFKHLRARLA